jgi:hypothetical protein
MYVLNFSFNFILVLTFSFLVASLFQIQGHRMRRHIANNSPNIYIYIYIGRPKLAKPPRPFFQCLQK